jgi:hypothetical protein
MQTAFGIHKIENLLTSTNMNGTNLLHYQPTQHVNPINHLKHLLPNKQQQQMSYQVDETTKIVIIREIDCIYLSTTLSTQPTPIIISYELMNTKGVDRALPAERGSLANDRRISTVVHVHVYQPV